MSGRQERGDKGKTGEDVFHLLFFWTILLDFAYKTLGSGVKRGRPGGTWCLWGGTMKLVPGEQRGCDMRLPLGELAFWVPLLAQSLEGRHIRVSPHTTAGSSHSKGVGEQTIHKKEVLVSFPSPCLCRVLLAAGLSRGAGSGLGGFRGWVSVH